MKDEMQALVKGVKEAEEVKALAHQLIASGAQKLSPEVVAGLRALSKEIQESKEVIREAIY